MFSHVCVEVSLDVEVFDYYFDYPVDFGEF